MFCGQWIHIECNGESGTENFRSAFGMTHAFVMRLPAVGTLS